MKAVFLDRDGVINVNHEVCVKTPDEWIAIPEALEAIRLLTQAGWSVFVVSNQASVGRGLLSQEMLEKIHQKMLHEIRQAGGEIKSISFCTSPEPDNPFRKPNPGMLLDLAERFQINLIASAFVGDHFRDIEAARRAGCHPILVLTGHGLHMQQQYKQELVDVPTFPHLLAFAQYWLRLNASCE